MSSQRTRLFGWSGSLLLAVLTLPPSGCKVHGELDPGRKDDDTEYYGRADVAGGGAAATAAAPRLSRAVPE
jgi:hypothetical protein